MSILRRHANPYYTLIGSLPALPSHFLEAERIPISSNVLQDRLKMLEPRDAEILQEFSEFLLWERQPIDKTDEDVVNHYHRFLDQTDYPFTHDLIRRAITIRTILAALRCRRLGLDPPPGIEPLATQIARNWNTPDFGMAVRFPWVPDIAERLTGDQPLEVEQSRLEITWTMVKRLADRYTFSFEAVILYLIRWEIVFRWTQRDETVGQQKFDKLVNDAMGQFSDMFPASSD